MKSYAVEDETWSNASTLCLACGFVLQLIYADFYGYDTILCELKMINN